MLVAQIPWVVIRVYSCHYAYKSQQAPAPSSPVGLHGRNARLLERLATHICLYHRCQHSNPFLWSTLQFYLASGRLSALCLSGLSPQARGVFLPSPPRISCLDRQTSQARNFLSQLDLSSISTAAKDQSYHLLLVEPGRLSSQTWRSGSSSSVYATRYLPGELQSPAVLLRDTSACSVMRPWRNLQQHRGPHIRARSCPSFRSSPDQSPRHRLRSDRQE